MRFSNKDTVMPDLKPNLKRRNWLLLVLLAALALFLYVSVVIKIMNQGF